MVLSDADLDEAADGELLEDGQVDEPLHLVPREPHQLEVVLRLDVLLHLPLARHALRVRVSAGARTAAARARRARTAEGSVVKFSGFGFEFESDFARTVNNTLANLVLFDEI